MAAASAISNLGTKTKDASTETEPTVSDIPSPNIYRSFEHSVNLLSILRGVQIPYYICGDAVVRWIASRIDAGLDPFEIDPREIIRPAKTFEFVTIVVNSRRDFEEMLAFLKVIVRPDGLDPASAISHTSILQRIGFDKSPDGLFGVNLVQVQDNDFDIINTGDEYTFSRFDIGSLVYTTSGFDVRKPVPRNEKKAMISRLRDAIKKKKATLIRGMYSRDHVKDILSSLDTIKVLMEEGWTILHNQAPLDQYSVLIIDNQNKIGRVCDLCTIEKQHFVDFGCCRGREHKTSICIDCLIQMLKVTESITCPTCKKDFTIRSRR